MSASDQLVEFNRQVVSTLAQQEGYAAVDKDLWDGRTFSTTVSTQPSTLVFRVTVTSLAAQHFLETLLEDRADGTTVLPLAGGKWPAAAATWEGRPRKQRVRLVHVPAGLDLQALRAALEELNLTVHALDFARARSGLRTTRVVDALLEGLIFPQWIELTAPTPASAAAAAAAGEGAASAPAAPRRATDTVVACIRVDRVSGLPGHSPRRPALPERQDAAAAGTPGSYLAAASGVAKTASAAQVAARTAAAASAQTAAAAAAKTAEAIPQPKAPPAAATAVAPVVPPAAQAAALDTTAAEAEAPAAQLAASAAGGAPAEEVGSAGATAEATPQPRAPSAAAAAQAAPPAAQEVAPDTVVAKSSAAAAAAPAKTPAPPAIRAAGATKPRSAPAQHVGGRRYPTRGKAQRLQREPSGSEDEDGFHTAKRVATGNCGPSMDVDSGEAPASNPYGVLDEGEAAPPVEVEMVDDPGSADGGAAAGANAAQA